MAICWSRYGLGDEVWLGGTKGTIVAGSIAAEGVAEFATPGGLVRATVLKAAGPDVLLAGVQVWLVQDVGATAPARYALMVDDAYWGVRVQPAAFAWPGIDESMVMGYRLEGTVLRDGDPQAGANVSLELRLETAEDGEVVVWDSEEYDELVYSAELETWVEGPTVLAPIRTGEDGCWTVLVPKGDGALYQREQDRRDESTETAEKALRRSVSEVWALHAGRRALAAEGSVAVIDVDSARLVVQGTPGAWIRISTMDDVGTLHGVPSGGEVEVGGLPGGEHSVAQFARNSWGSWDSSRGCARALVELTASETAELAMGPLETYSSDGSVVAGRVYERPGVPAVGLDVVAIDLELGEIVCTVATTDGGGHWQAAVPESGFGGDLFIHSATWGSLPVLGTPYSDVCLGARAYSSWRDEFRPEAWRKGSRGHRNHPYVPGSIWVTDAETEAVYTTVEASYGGWVTEATLPKCRYIADLQELVAGGPQLRRYDLVDAEGVLEAGFTLGSQPFEEWETPPGLFRATGYYPEAKLLLGGKVHGDVVVASDARVDEGEPEAARVGLEFGDLSAYAEVRLGLKAQRCSASAVSGLVCPYCGGPAHRDPEPDVAERGYCLECAAAFGTPQAMDCRSYFRSPTLEAGRRLGQRALATRKGRTVSRMYGFHWRPDLYDETDAYLTQSGAGQATNAPRWFAKHVSELGDGLGLARFDGDASPTYQGGHPLAYFGSLPGIERDLGLAQFKVVFDVGDELPADLLVEVDCVRSDGSVETQVVQLTAGLRGPCAEAPFGDAVRLVRVPKAWAEGQPAPYAGAGLYSGVSGLRVAAPEGADGCRFTVVADVPFLASAEGVPVRARRSVPVALDLAGVWGNPHLMTDSVGQVFLTYARDGDLVVHRRGGVAGQWDEGTLVLAEGANDHPWTAKDARGTLVLVAEHSGSATVALTSRDDARHMEG